MAGLSTFQSGSKGSEMVNLDVFDHLGLFWACLDSFGPFQTKNDFLLKCTSDIPYFVFMGHQIVFCLKWYKSVQMPIWAQKGPKLSKTSSFTISDPFWTLLDHFGRLTSLPCLAIFVCFISAFFGTPCTKHAS